MKYFQKGKEWVVDMRNHNFSMPKSHSRQIDKIRASLPCSVAEAFVIVGIFFESLPEQYTSWDKSLKNKKLFDSLQNISNDSNKMFYVLFFDDDSPVVFRGSKIALFKTEEEIKFTYGLISKKLNLIGSNAVLQSYLFKPDKLN